MEAEARYTWVGLAVLALLAAAVASMLWLKNVGGDRDLRRYAIYFERQSLDGLEVGADVDLRGIKVGRVEDYALADGGVNRVRVEVRVDRRTPVRTNTVAVVTRNYVTGIASIALVTREPAGAPLDDAPAGERHPVIAEGRSELDDLTGRVDRIGDMAATALTNLNQLLAAENRDAAIDAVRKVGNLAAGLEQRLGALDRALGSVDAAARSFGAASTRLAQAGERTTLVVERFGERIDTTFAEADRTLVDTRQAALRLADASVAVQQQASATARRLEDSAARLDDRIDAAASELRLGVETAARTFDRLRDPRAALLGPSRSALGPGEDAR
jgi:phospholipid/cholesterol/gamma-HCH transport system substrate-binding protein